MNQFKKTTTKPNRSPIKVSVSEALEEDRTLQLSQLPERNLSEDMTDAPEDRQLSHHRAPGTPETRRRIVDGNSDRARSPVASTALLKWLLDRLTRSKGWLAVVTLVGVWGWWNSQLLFSTGLGITAMMLVYRGQSRPGQLLREQIEQFWDGPNRRFVLAVGSGGMITLGTYMSLAMWADSESHWMAVSAILQNFGTIAIVGLLLRQALNLGVSQNEAVLDRLLSDLTDADPVKRLIAVRQMTDLVNNGGFGAFRSVKSSFALAKRSEGKPSQRIARNRAAECFRLMLSQEPEALVRNALLEGLQTWDNTYGITLKSKNKVIDY
ncbi:hypothetical protein C7B69_07360 [filamentous cyanobacterium Phorm 46]|nr:hypothetical protein C7B69_07360 [filamentous cyanobacterium Phorm 46]